MDQSSNCKRFLHVCIRQASADLSADYGGAASTSEKGLTHHNRREGDRDGGEGDLALLQQLNDALVAVVLLEDLGALRVRNEGVEDDLREHVAGESVQAKGQQRARARARQGTRGTVVLSAP